MQTFISINIVDIAYLLLTKGCGVAHVSLWGFMSISVPLGQVQENGISAQSVGARSQRNPNQEKILLRDMSGQAVAREDNLKTEGRRVDANWL